MPTFAGGSSGPIDLNQLRRIHQRFATRNRAMVDAALKVAQRQAAEHVRNRSTFKRRKAKSLKDATKGKIIKSRGGRILRLTWPKKYAGYVEYGTRPHIIRPRRRRALRFRVGGAVVFARRVNHPGTKPYKYAWKATHSAHRVLGEHLVTGMRQAAAKF